MDNNNDRNVVLNSDAIMHLEALRKFQEIVKVFLNSSWYSNKVYLSNYLQKYLSFVITLDYSLKLSTHTSINQITGVT